MNFHPQRFLYYLLAGLLAWQAAIFSFGVWSCSKVSPITELKTVCPDLGDRYEIFVNSSLGAILGLIGGAAATQALSKRKEPPGPKILGKEDEKPRP